MLKKLSVSRKKKPTSKLANSRSKVNKQPQKQHIQIKERKISNKHNHHVSTLSLLSHHNASQSSLVEQSKLAKAKKGKSKNRESSVSLVMKQGATKQKQRSKNQKQSKKGKKNSSSNNEKSKKTILKISPLKIQKSDKNIRLTKQNVGKKSKICNQQQLYERINLGLFKSKTNSQINFSNNSSVRQNNNASAVGVNVVVNDSKNMGQGRHKKTLTIDCSDQYILNQYFSNSRIKNYDKKKVQAAVKIQKVFRGYLTRKMLQQYILKEEERLYQLSRKAKSSSSRQSIDYEGHHFQELAALKKQQNDAFKKYSNAKAVPKMFMENLTPLNFAQSRQHSRKRQGISELSGEDIEISMKNSKKQRLTPIDHEALDEQSSIYAHPHDSISRYLPFDVKNQQHNQHSESLFYENIGQHDAEYEESENFIKLKNSHRMMEDKSQELLKYTPSSYAPKSKSKVEDPMPTDFSDKRVEQFEFDGPESRSKQLQQEIQKHKNQKPDPKSNYFTQLQILKPTQKQPQNPQPLQKYPTTNPNPNILLAGSTNKEQEQRKSISILKKQQKQKWNVIIQMLNQQISQTKSRNLDHQKFMSMILEFSKKNKQQLEKSNSFSIQQINTRVEDKQSTFFRMVQEERVLMGRDKTLSPVDQESLELVESRRRKSEGKQQLRMQKNMDLPLRDKKYTNLSINLYNPCLPKHTSPRYNKQNSSMLDKTEELKKFYRKNWVNYPIQQMVYIREKALQKREMDMVNKLNQDLYHQKLTHQQFIQRLSELQGKFENQRELVNKAKMDIFLGCRATHRLLQDSAKDAWYLGYKIPFSQSLKQFPSNHPNIWVKDLIVDQLKSFSNHQNTNKNTTTSKQPQLNNSTYKQQKNNEIISQRQRSDEKRKQDLSISLPHEDSSLTLRPSNQVSQQSLLSEEISYNQGDVEIHLLETQQIDNKGIIYRDEESDSDQEDSRYEEVVEGFRKITADKLVKKVENDRKNIMIFGEGPLFIDPSQQQKVEKQVMKKISINQPKLISNQAACRLEELRRYEMTPRHKISSSLQPKSEIYKVDVGSESDSDEIIFNEDMDPEIKRITQDQITKLVWETVNQIFVNQSMRIKFCKTKNRPPTVIEYEERIKFANLLVKQIPNFKILLPRINQKMVASRLELLKFMRVSFDQQQMFDEGEQLEENLDMSDQFEQIGKFEHILPAEVCINALDKYMKQQQQKQSKTLNEVEQSSIEQKIRQKYKHHLTPSCLKKATQRQQALHQSKTQRIQLRKQIQKVQYHCIFDSLNQILMKKRLKSTGYSGIGLNQLTLILQKQNIKQIKYQQEYIKILNQSIEQLNNLINNDKTNNQKLLMENYQRLCQNDSQWVYYTDQALSFALEIVYMLEDQIFFQEATVISKKVWGI